MRKHIQLIAGILLLLASNILTAQDKAAGLVNSLSQSLKKHKNTEVVFTYQTTDESKVKEGKAYLQGEAYKILLEEQHTISDGKSSWTYLVEEEEVYISDNDEDSINPLELFTEIENGGTPKLKGTDAKGNTVVELFDKDGSSTGIILKFAKKGDLKGFEMVYDEGSVVFDITDIKFDLDLKDSFFSFDEKDYPGVEIIDMR